MKEKNEWDNLEPPDWGDEKITGNYVNRGEKSTQVFDFTTVEKINEIMRFDIVNSLEFSLPQKNESIFSITTKPISLLDVLNYLINKLRMPNEVFIYLFTVNAKAANYISYLANKTKLNIIISDIINSKREKERLVTKVFESNNVDITFCHSHAKIISAKFDDNYITITGSMNAGTNAKIETLQVLNNKQMYDFVANNYQMLKEKFNIPKRY